MKIFSESIFPLCTHGSSESVTLHDDHISIERWSKDPAKYFCTRYHLILDENKCSHCRSYFVTIRLTNNSIYDLESVYHMAWHHVIVPYRAQRLLYHNISESYPIILDTCIKGIQNNDVGIHHIEDICIILENIRGDRVKYLERSEHMVGNVFPNKRKQSHVHVIYELHPFCRQFVDHNVEFCKFVRIASAELANEQKVHSSSIVKDSVGR